MKDRDVSVRNPVYIQDQWIDCEIDHPKFGWIPYTAEADAKSDFMRAVYRKAESLGPQPYNPPPLSAAEMTKRARQARERDYRGEADPLYFQAERGEIDRQVWLDKCAEIKARHPMPTEKMRNGR